MIQKNNNYSQIVDKQFRALYASLKISESDLKAKEKYLAEKLEIDLEIEENTRNTKSLIFGYAGRNTPKARVERLEGMLVNEEPKIFENLSR